MGLLSELNRKCYEIAHDTDYLTSPNTFSLPIGQACVLFTTDGGAHLVASLSNSMAVTHIVDKALFIINTDVLTRTVSVTRASGTGEVRLMILRFNK